MRELLRYHSLEPPPVHDHAGLQVDEIPLVYTSYVPCCACYYHAAVVSLLRCCVMDIRVLPALQPAHHADGGDKLSLTSQGR